MKKDLTSGDPVRVSIALQFIASTDYISIELASDLYQLLNSK